jgi:phosphoenolpyruvate---glycerone phosphotransferase subunit DhaK
MAATNATMRQRRESVQKIINDPASFTDESLAGILAAHPQSLRAVSRRGIVRADAPVRGKVAIATGGGYGHLPLFLGYVGRGLADGVAVGDVFSSPSHAEMLAVTEAINGGAGVLYLYGNYGGDTMNFDLAAELAAEKGIRVATLLGADDVASAPSGSEADRRGVAGIFFLYKIAGAKAAEGASLDEVVTVTAHAASLVRSMGVALSPCTVPAAGHPTFSVADGEMELGMGIHGEPGARSGPLETADEIAAQLVGTLLADLPYEPGESAAVLVNSLGATPREELYILYRKVHELLGKAGVTVARAFVGEYATSLEMAGASLSLLKLDDELSRLLAAPAESPLVTYR